MFDKISDKKLIISLSKNFGFLDAKKDLEAKCDMIIDDDGNVLNNREDEEDQNQISLFEVVLLPTWFQTAVAT